MSGFLKIVHNQRVMDAFFVFVLFCFVTVSPYVAQADFELKRIHLSQVVVHAEAGGSLSSRLVWGTGRSQMLGLKMCTTDGKPDFLYNLPQVFHPNSELGPPMSFSN